jgi:hypothetical protein
MDQPVLDRLAAAIEDAQADPGVTRFSLSISWDRPDDRLDCMAEVYGNVEGEEWGSGETNGSDPGEVLDRARTTEMEE